MIVFKTTLTLSVVALSNSADDLVLKGNLPKTTTFDDRIVRFLKKTNKTPIVAPTKTATVAPTKTLNPSKTKKKKQKKTKKPKKTENPNQKKKAKKKETSSN
jgi:outer membrane biosynthesis protein TonB